MIPIANKIVIDVEARFIDNVSGEAGAASSAFKKVETTAKSAAKEVDNLGKKKADPKVDADTDKFKKAMDSADKKLDKFGKTKATATLLAEDRATSKILKVLNALKKTKAYQATVWVKDKATTVIKKITSGLKWFSGKTYSASVKIRDSEALSSLRKLSSAGDKIAGKTWKAVVGIKDMATAPLRSIKNMLFSIQTLATAVFAGFAAKKLVVDPVNTADQYSSAKIGFSTLIGESGAQKMMDDLDEFAKRTPFKTSGVIESARKMMAMGWDTDNLLGDLEVFGNAAAATGNLNQGLESIVRAMSQIKTKGRLSTEELNQLAEAGIAAKAMLAEQLGYGTGDAGIAAMTEDLEKGAIASDKAIAALIAGMQKYDGMMDSMANETVEGLISQLGDAYEISVKRRWGQGLQDGLKRALGTGVDLVDDAEAALEKLGDTMYELGSKVSNWLADKFQVAVDKFNEITDSFEFQEADLGGKLSMLWKGLVADPLKEWFNDLWTDEENIEKATEIGQKVAKGLTEGILTVLGLTDIFAETGEGAESKGSNIAQGFAKGFVDGFDVSAITEKLKEAISNVWNALPTWAKIALGTYGAGKVAGGIANFAGGVASFMGGVGSIIGTTGTIGAGNSVVGAAGLLGLMGKTGVAGVGSSGILGGLANTGYYLMGGTSALAMGGGTAALIGGGSIAGGLAAGAGLIHAGKTGYEAYQGFKEGDKTKGWANVARSGTTIAGIGAGAMIGAKAGTAVGALFGGVGAIPGALIGAGLGAVAGWIGGDKIAKSIEAAKYETEEMQEAIKDSDISAEELAQTFEKAKWETAKKNFGDIALSMDEIARLSQQLVFGEDLAKFDNFAAAAKTAKASLQQLNAAGQQTDRWMWKAGLGVTFNEDEVEAITASFDEYINSAKAYVENKHYEFSTSADLILDLESDTGKNILEIGNAYYAQIQKDLNAAGEELGKLLTDSIADGFINAEETEAIEAAQKKIADITKKIADAEADAELTLIELKYGKDIAMDVDSFNAFLQATQENLNSRLQSTDAALEAQITNLNLRFPEDQRNSEEYKEQLKAIIDGYNLQVEGVTADILSFELNVLGDAFSGETALGANAMQDLKNILSKCIQDNKDPAELNLADLIEITGDEGLASENASLITDYLSSIYDQLNLSDYESITIEADGTVKLNLKPEESAETKVQEIVDGVTPDAVDTNVAVNIHGNKNVDPVTVLAEEFGVPPMVAKDVLLELSASPTYLNQVEILCQQFGIEPTQAETILWELSGDPIYQNNINPTPADFGIPGSINHTMTINITGVPVYGSGFGALGPSKVHVKQFRGGIVGGTSAMASFARGGIIDDNIPGFSDGGIVRGGSQLIEVAEEGNPEMVIPLSSQRRGRALKLWAQAGNMMGVPGFARGGIIGSGSTDEGIRFNDDGGGGEAPGGQSVQVDVGGITLEIHVNGSNPENIVQAIKEQLPEIAEAVAGALAEAVSGQFQNTPLRGGVA